jgi:hypothetical protein
MAYRPIRPQLAGERGRRNPDHRAPLFVPKLELFWNLSVQSSAPLKVPHLHDRYVSLCFHKLLPPSHVGVPIACISCRKGLAFQEELCANLGLLGCLSCWS